MNFNDVLRVSGASPEGSELYRRCDEARKLFAQEHLQYLDCVDAARCQALLGHGDQYGVWQTPESLVGRRLPPWQAIMRLRERLNRYLPDEFPRTERLEALLDEGVLSMTRYALLLRMGPSSFQKKKGSRSLDATSVILELQSHFPAILAQGIQRRLQDEDAWQEGLVRYLSPEDVRRMSQDKYLGVVVRRMAMFGELGLWSDAPVIACIGNTTNPKGSAVSRPKEEKSNPYLPIPDDYMAEMGERVLWIVRDLGPNLTALAEALPNLGTVNRSSVTFKKRLRRYFSRNVFRDREGRPIIQPPFRIEFESRAGAHFALRGNIDDEHDWPPRTWQHVQALMVTLQSSHLWIALLAMAGRVQEVLTLQRNCVEPSLSGDMHVTGKTYKLSEKLAGEDREWPAPEILVDALAQQVKLVSACERVEWHRGGGDDDADELRVVGSHLWASLGTGNRADPEKQLIDVNHALRKLTKRFGMVSKPGGRNLHTHRFRKTIARLAALAIVDSPRVLMQLFGHRDIAMTLHYILTDKALQLEIEQIAQELRIMRCQEVIEDIRTSLHNVGAPSFGGHGGGAAPYMVESIKTQEEELHRQGRLWDVDSAYELAVILTNQGQYFRVVKPGVLCTKPSREASPCKCGSDCENRIEDKTARRDVTEIVPVLIKQGQLALEENRLLLVANVVEQLEEELARFDDICATWSANPELIALREAVKS
jgi:integrase